jgi:replication factor C small subunit
MDILNTLWIERYRPKTLEDLVLPEEVFKDFKQYILKKEIPHLIFSGPPGSGKSTLARILCSKNGIISSPDDNLLELNGSAKETRSINFVNEVIEPFLKVPPLGDSYKIVFIDEADYLTDASFHSLRGIIEKYSEKARFVLTCNYLSKIPDAVLSRCTGYSFKQFPIKDVIYYCDKILRDEGVNFPGGPDNPALKYIIDNLYPDIRKIVNALQRCSTSGELKVNKDIVQTSEKTLVSLIMEVINFIQSNQDHKLNSCISSIVQLLTSNQDLEFRSVYVDLFNRPETPIPAKIIVNKFTNSHQDCLVPSMHVLAMVYEIIEILQKYKQIKK